MSTDTQSTRLWRTLICVNGWTRDYMYIRIPGYAAERIIKVKKAIFPSSILSTVKQGGRYFHAHVNIGAENDRDLRFERWESE